MIIGIGSDLVDIRRIEKTLERFGQRFLERVFTPEEQARAEGKVQRAAVYARRFAAKEAAWKALGEGFRRGIAWRELQVSNTASGKPVLSMAGSALERLHQLVPNGMIPRIDLSLSDDPPIAFALVMISADSPTEHAQRRSL